jgi:hypothetical protein
LALFEESWHAYCSDTAVNDERNPARSNELMRRP